MTEEAKTCFEILKKAARFGVADCQLCPAYPVCPTDTAGWNNECMLETAADLIESLSAENEILNAAIGQLGTIECHRDMLEHELEQVTRERDALQVEIDVLNEEYYAGIHTIRPAVDAEPVRHGRWIDHGDYITTAYGSLDLKICSICNCEVTLDGYDYYCPNCGAKMDGDKDAVD